MTRPGFAILLLCGAAMSAQATEYTGYISDAKCAAKGKGADPAHAACAVKCIQKGELAVFVVGDKVYKVADQSKVVEHAGKKVTIDGTVDGDSIKVEKIKVD
jgi:hypothetical protein